jgi:hypothetical protein
MLISLMTGPREGEQHEVPETASELRMLHRIQTIPGFSRIVEIMYIPGGFSPREWVLCPADVDYLQRTA